MPFDDDQEPNRLTLFRMPSWWFSFVRPHLFDALATHTHRGAS